MKIINRLSKVISGSKDLYVPISITASISTLTLLKSPTHVLFLKNHLFLVERKPGLAGKIAVG